MTHDVAIEFTQIEDTNETMEEGDHLFIPRHSKSDMSTVVFSELSPVTTEYHQGKNKPLPPPIITQTVCSINAVK